MPSWTLDISRRLRLAEKPSGSGRTGVVIAVAGVALAVVVMEIALAVVFGFKEQIRRKLVGFESQVSVLPPYDYATQTTDPLIDFTPDLREAIGRHLPGVSSTLTMRLPAMLKTRDDFSAVYLLARDENHDVDFERSNVVRGVWPDFAADTAAIVLSEIVAGQLGLDVGDRIPAYFFVDGAVSARRFDVAGIYRSDFGEYDRSVAYASLGMLQGVLGCAASEGTAVEINGLPMRVDSLSQASLALADGLLLDFQLGRVGRAWPVTDVLHTGIAFFSWLDLLDTNVAVIFVLMLLVAGFTLISSLFIIILERVPTIGLLRSLGATRREVSRIFSDMAMRLVLSGMLIGNVLALSFLFVQQYTGFVHLNPDMYYLSAVPVSIRFWPFVALNVGTALVSWAILLIPAGAASRIDPASTMRYE